MQIVPNFIGAESYGNFFAFANISFCFVAQYYYLNQSFVFCLSISLAFFYQHIIHGVFNFVYSQNTNLLAEKVGDYASILSSIQSHVFKTDLNYDIIFINKVFLGKTFGELIGSSFKTLPIYKKSNFDKFLITQTTQTYKIEIEYKGENYLFMVSASPIWINQEITGITILCTDTTYELEMKKKEIEHEKQIFALKSKTEFIASISHEIRNPLQALTFSIENLISNEPRKDQIGILNEAQNSNQLINHIIGDILDSSKIENGNFQLKVKNFEVLETIESAMKINIPQAFKKSLDFTYSIDFEIPRIIKGDSQRLIQILSNLISNSIKYTNEGKIELIVKNIEKQKQNSIYFSIKDTGIGIKKEDFKKIFTMFERVDETNQSNGWGIGLSICKGLIELMNGNYGVESEHGNGSTFWFEIPYEKTKETHSLMNSLPISNFKTIIFVLQDEEISEEMNNLLVGMKASNLIITKSKEKIGEIYNNSKDCKIFIEDDLLYQLPPNIPIERIAIIGNSSKKSSEYNDCLRLFKPILPSHLIMELTPTAKKKFSGNENILQGTTVLIVEDHIVIQKCLKKYVEKMSPKKIFVASNGEDALKYYENEDQIDLVLTDINMPIMNGFELIKSIKNFEKSCETKIIVATGELNNQVLLDFIKEWKVDDILLKPITYKSLLASIRNLLE